MGLEGSGGKGNEREGSQARAYRALHVAVRSLGFILTKRNTAEEFLFNHSNMI